MLPHNKKLLIYIAVLFIILYSIITVSFYYILKNIAINQNEKKLHNILLYEQAQKNYIDKYQKKYIYYLQSKNALPKDFFDPVLMSATFITRQTLEEYNKLRKQENLPLIKYKIASDNPRNPINKADEFELKILDKFNKKEIDIFSKKMKINGKDYIYYAIPVVPNNKTCMKCHSDPNLAPKDLIKKYGDKAGFHEKIGHIRALLSLTLPLEEEYALIKKISMIFNIILLGLFIFTYIIIYLIILKLDKKDKQIIESSYIDELTQIFNRKKFNTDIKNNIKNSDTQTPYLMLIDIDHFKKINDTHGHPVGDYVLEQLSKLISDNIRSNDKFYRIGGEEFAIISNQKSNEDEMKFAEKIKKIIENYNFEKAGDITISIGFTKYQPNESYHKWYKRADEALYEAKKTRNTIVEK
ncbi:inner membrane protein YcdT [Nautilia profundicola AmH]|uniref:diguanylate cyclase n=1 Tax=Nautilia profundicola (strain ATCC BAA-1463 / DSM 18972 / AmH) TaxID=598659 RepID=B9L5U9_NAUPA|nr:diguanylate cyclase [Nautilia profundicola]ACM93324.1 inner membrane protein YcdT [Nautilia profundicola AmH]